MPELSSQFRDFFYLKPHKEFKTLDLAEGQRVSSLLGSCSWDMYKVLWPLHLCLYGKGSACILLFRVGDDQVVSMASVRPPPSLLLGKSMFFRFFFQKKIEVLRIA